MVGGQQLCLITHGWKVFHFLEQPGPDKLYIVPFFWVCPFQSKDRLTHLCQGEAKEYIFQVQDRVHLLFWRDQNESVWFGTLG